MRQFSIWVKSTNVSTNRMKQLKEDFLNLRRLPARLTGEQVAILLGFEEHDIAPLVQKKFLKPLGHPAKNCVKLFWLNDVLELAENRDQLAKASDAIRRRANSKGAAARRPVVDAEAA